MFCMVKGKKLNLVGRVLLTGSALAAPFVNGGCGAVVGGAVGYHLAKEADAE
jgi:hypothetical protein